MLICSRSTKECWVNGVQPYKILLAHNRYLLAGGERQAVEMELQLLRDHGHEVKTYFEDNQRIATLGRHRTAARTVWSTTISQ